MSDNSILENEIGRSRYLPPQGSWPESHHRMDKQSVYALIAALSANRPLLVRGEPGVGKSQLARAAAVVLNRRLISTVIQPNSEYEELLWAIDYTQRLADAQLAGALKDRSILKDVDEYVSPGPLWYALDWKEADGKHCKQNYRPPKDDSAPDAVTAGVVLLIDEIDKADISLTNGLLEVLGNGRFDVRPSSEIVKPCEGVPKPLVVLTSNDTRQLPAAMLRRCVILDLELPNDPDTLITHLVDIGKTHYCEVDEKVLEAAAKQIVDDRQHCHQLPKTGQAEYLDFLRALQKNSATTEGQLEWIDKLGIYFCRSHSNRQ